MALAKRPKTAVCEKPSLPLNDSRRACEICPSWVILSIIDAQCVAFSVERESARAI